MLSTPQLTASGRECGCGPVGLRDGAQLGTVLALTVPGTAAAAKGGSAVPLCLSAAVFEGQCFPLRQWEGSLRN